MTRNASQSCNVDHDEMKNNFQMKDSLIPINFIIKIKRNMS